MTVRHSSDLDVADLRHQGFKPLGQIPLHDLRMVEVELQFQIGRADGLENTQSLA